MIKIVLRLLLLALVIGFFYYLYQKGEQPSETRPFAPYRLDELASKPLPKQVFLDGVRLYAVGLCKDNKFLRIIKHEQAACLQHVEQQHSRCLALIAEQTPETFAERAPLQTLSEQYVGCVTPKP
ncbi:MAG TPA: hypothetical protein VFV64_08490 [Permianibacter sp.]|nr:hypothetical protein [Permianibacter sp.]